PRDSALHVLNRLAYGATPGLVDQLLREGVMHWIDRQLAVNDLDDPGLKGELARYELLQTPTRDLLRDFLEVRQQRQLQKRDAAADSMMTPEQRLRNATPEERALRQLAGQLPGLVLIRATRSERQLGEVLA